MKLNKRQFLRAAAALGGTAWLGLGCDSEEDGQDPDADDGGTSTGTEGEGCEVGASHTAISSNHGHSLTVPAADIVAATTKEYNIRGTSDHDHTVTLSATHFASLAAGEMVEVTSQGGPHSHSVTVACG